MILKKTFLLASALSVLGLSVAAQAGGSILLTVSNQTNEVSSVMITSSHICSGKLGQATPGKSSKSYDTDTVKALCGKNTQQCMAEVYMSTNCSKDSLAAKAMLDMPSDTVTITELDSTKYNVTASKNTVEINYKN